MGLIRKWGTNRRLGGGDDCRAEGRVLRPCAEMAATDCSSRGEGRREVLLEGRSSEGGSVGRRGNTGVGGGGGSKDARDGEMGDGGGR